MSQHQIVTLQKIDSLTFHHPVCLIISGTTGSGKSNFVANIIKYDAIDGDIKNIYYFVPQIENLDIITRPDQELHIREGLPTRQWCLEKLDTGKRDNLVVIDDQWTKCVGSDAVTHLISVGRRHWGVSIICIAQNYYQKGNNSSLIK